MDGVSKPIKHKVFAYITSGSRLLVFEHPEHPEAGVQVPAGTLEQDETSVQGVLREAHEETGLAQLSVVSFLGEQMRDMVDFGKHEVHHRYFYHLVCHQTTPESWLNYERYPSDPAKSAVEDFHLFRFYWISLQQPPALTADHGYYLAQLRAQQH